MGIMKNETDIGKPYYKKKEWKKGSQKVGSISH